MLVPLAVLALGAAFAGVAFRHWFIGGGVEGFWRNALFIGPANHILEEMEHVPALVSLSPTLMMLGGLLVAYYMYLVDRTAPKRLADLFPPLYRFLLNKWYFDELYDVDLRAAGLRDRPAVLEGRRRRDHRRPGAGRDLGAGARRDARRRPAADRATSTNMRSRCCSAWRRSRPGICSEGPADVRFLDPSGLLAAADDRRAVHPAAAGRDGGDASATRAGSRSSRPSSRSS